MNDRTVSPGGIDRRAFVRTVSQAGLAAAMAPSLFAAAAPAPAAPAASAAPRRRYAIVGTGSRHAMYRTALTQTYREHAELVALCDLNPGRLELSRGVAAQNGSTVPGYAPSDFERMIRETRAQTIIVTTMDSTHDDYIVRAMEAGCDVITEKPMTTDGAKCQRILDTQKRTGRNIRVTFNYRYSPPRTQVKDLLMSGVIGDILSADFQWLLNTQHGADYFRRWHSQKRFSGGLMVHKATHHFDLMNWWLGAMPVEVQATGKREFYTPTMARRLGLEGSHQRCQTCPETAKCTFYLNLASGGNKALYLDQEKHDGYFRDQCVFRPEIDIEDTMNVMVKYDTSATMSYSLNAFNAWEGYHVAFNGTKGRLEHSLVEQLSPSGADFNQAGLTAGAHTRIIPMRGAANELKVWTGEGSHGGGDALMLDEIFIPNRPADKYLRSSDHRGGAASILTGIAANRCFATGQPVKVADLVTGLQRPDYAPMPTRTEPVPMPRAPAPAAVPAKS
jgi:predicted dehydrogenase